jgi:hypothetical protein
MVAVEHSSHLRGNWSLNYLAHASGYWISFEGELAVIPEALVVLPDSRKC